MRCRVLDASFHFLSLLHNVFVQGVPTKEVAGPSTNNAYILVALVDCMIIYYHLVPPRNDRLFYMVARIGVWIFDVLHHAILLPIDTYRVASMVVRRPPGWEPLLAQSICTLWLHSIMCGHYAEHVVVLVASLADIPNRRAHGAGDY